MQEHLLREVIAHIARHLGRATEKLHGGQLITPDGWYAVALICHVHLAEGFIFWQRPEQPRAIRDIAEIIHQHNITFAA